MLISGLQLQGSDDKSIVSSKSSGLSVPDLIAFADRVPVAVVTGLLLPSNTLTVISFQRFPLSAPRLTVISPSAYVVTGERTGIPMVKAFKNFL